MKHAHHEQVDPAIKTPLWKWLVLALIILGLPMYYTFFGDAQIAQNAVQMDNASPQSGQNKLHSPGK